MRARTLRQNALLVALAGLSVLSAPLFAAEPIVQIPTGELVERVAAKAFPGQSYALYLPAGYSPDRAYPALFLFDARERGAVAAKRFVPAAEALGWIVISSNNSQSDTSMDPNLAAMKAMHEDALARFAIDPKRLYAGGFSGGARAACLMAIVYPEEVVGVIGASGGFPFDRPPSKATPFAFFASVGDQDFNWYELRALDKTLGNLGLRHRLATFDGGHQWPPEAVATQAIEWFELLAIKEGRRAKDPALVARLLQKRADAGRSLEASPSPGARADAYLAWRDLAADLTGEMTGLAEASEATARAAALGADKGVRADLAARDERDRRDLESIERARQALASVPADEVSSSLGRLLAALRIKELQKKAAGADRAESLSAERVLSQIEVQTGFYLPQALLLKKDWARAALFLEIATTIRPQNYDSWFLLAQARAQGGNRKRALEALHRAIHEGFRDSTAIESNPLLTPLRTEAGFRAAIESARKTQPVGSSG